MLPHVYGTPQTFYVMGASAHIDPGARNAPGSYWTTLEAFPTPAPTRYYLVPGGGLDVAPPAGSAPVAATFVYDPANPVPTVGGSNLFDSCGPQDQVGGRFKRRGGRTIMLGLVFLFSFVCPRAASIKRIFDTSRTSSVR